MEENKIPLYIYIRRFVDEYDDKTDDYEYFISLMEKYIWLLEIINISKEEIGAGMVFLEKLPKPFPLQHYQENRVLLVLKEQILQEPEVCTFFHNNNVEIMKKLNNYLDFVRRGEG